MSEFDAVMRMTTEQFAEYEKWTQWLRMSTSPLAEIARLKLWIADAKSVRKRKTQAEKMRDWRTKRRGGRPSRKWVSWKGRESCPVGHSLAGANLRQRRHRDGRVDACCRICDNARQAAYRQRKASNRKAA